MSTFSVLSIAQTLLLVVAATPSHDSYVTARKKSVDAGEPLLVLVTADWCRGCVVIKKTVLPQLRESGKLNGIHYTEVDIDKEQSLAKQLSASAKIPQLIFFTKEGEGWRRWEMNGTKSAEEITGFLDNAKAESVATMPEDNPR